jgi:hypothetical protein
VPLELLPADDHQRFTSETASRPLSLSLAGSPFRNSIVVAADVGQKQLKSADPQRVATPGMVKVLTPEWRSLSARKRAREKRVSPSGWSI